MKPVCVGRFLIDVPVQAEVILSHERIAGFDVETVEEGEQAFLERIARRAADIETRAAGAGAAGPGGMVRIHELAVPGMVGRTLVHGRERSYGIEHGRRVDIEWVSVEAHAHTGGLSVSLSMDHASEAKAVEAEALLARLRRREEDEVPELPGFCIGPALFADPLPPHKTEHIAMHLGLPAHPDLALAFASMPGGGSDAGLLARVAETDAAAHAEDLLRVTKLRIGKRDANGLAGEEVLERFRELNFATTYAFMWEVRGRDDDPLQPFLSLELQAGAGPRAGAEPAGASLHEDAIVALWDSIAGTVRLRPSRPSRPPEGPPEPAPRAPGTAPSAAVPGAAAPGATAGAGETCLQTGWWRCSEDAEDVEVEGGPVRYIRKDERMPQAQLLSRPTIWQKLRGIQPRTEPGRPTAWTLVDRRQRPRTPSLVTLAPCIAADQGPEPGLPGDIAPGTEVRTGERCPASGWWRCGEAMALDGTRWFPRAGLLPAATFHVPARGFGRLEGAEVIQRRSTWQLVRHAEAERSDKASADGA